jgi:hypothetical protein
LIYKSILFYNKAIQSKTKQNKAIQSNTHISIRFKNIFYEKKKEKQDSLSLFTTNQNKAKQSNPHVSI